MRKIRPFKLPLQTLKAFEIGLILLLILLLPINPSSGSDKVTLQLAWKHQFQFAGYYAALHKEYYHQAGLDVTIVEGGDGRFAREEVLVGNAQYGVAGAELILHREDGDPFVVLATIFQHSPSILLATRNSGISNLQDLIGKRVMLLPGKKDADILAAFLNEGVSLEAIERMDQTYNLNDLIEGRTDAVSAYITNEPWHLMQEDIEPVIISPQTYGVDFYSDCLFTTENEIENHPRRVQAFLEATRRGWEYAMDHPEAIIDLLLKDYEVQKKRDHLRYEAESIRKIMLPELVQIGHMNPGRWRHIASTYVKLGMIDPGFSPEEFLYDPHSGVDYTGLKRIAGTAIALTVVLSIGALFLYFFNRKLTNEVVERKRVEKALRASEEHYQRLVELSPDLIAIHQDGKVLYINKAGAGLLGFSSPKQVIGNLLTEFIPEDQKKITDERIERLLKEGTQSSVYEQTIVRNDGIQRDFEIVGIPFPRQDGTAVQIIARDVTERKQTEQQLRYQNQFIQTILDNLPVGLAVHFIDEGKATYINKKFEEIYGWPKNELVDIEAFFEKVYPDATYREKIKNKIMADIRSGDPERMVWEGVAVTGQNGQKKIVSAQNIPLYEQNLMISTVQDITEYKKLQKQLQQVQKLESVGRLAGGVAHDFNNMLGVILGNTELAMEQVDSSSPMRTELEEIQKAAHRSADLTRQLLAFARRQTASPKVLDLNDAVTKMLKMLRRLIGENIDLAWMPGAALWPVKIDPAQIDQILANLCVNARDAISGVGKVTIATQNLTLDEAYCAEHPECIPGDYVRLSVSDDGHGMDKETLENLFEPFFTTKAVGEGTGLGLATVYGIVKQNNGQISVYSELGRGSTFKIYIPRTQETLKKAEPDTGTVSKGTETVLFVEDEPTILRLGQSVLERFGYTVLAAGKPSDALTLAEQHDGPIHILVTDVVMPEMDGKELKEHIEKRKPGIKVLFMSGYPADVIVHRGILEKDVDFLSKPFTVNSLAGKVREALDQT